MGFIYLSESSRHLLGIDPAETFAGLNSFLLDLHPEDLAHLMTRLNESAKGLTQFQWTGRYLHEDRTKFMEAIALPRIQADGTIIWDGLLLDVTENREMAFSLERERARSIGAAKMAALGEMAAGVAHEINNPLAVIMGKAEQLVELAGNNETRPEKILDSSQKIIKMAGRIAQTIRGLRSFARDAKDDPYDARALRSILEDTIELCQTRFRNHNVDLQIPQIPDSLTIECRGVQISQVFLNLLNNSFDAVLENPTPQPWVRFEYSDKESEVEIYVTDSGTGITPEIAARIMTPFFTTKKVGKGTGLGLSISKDIIENHGGRFELDTSSPNTRFRIVLPKEQPKKTSTHPTDSRNQAA